MILKRQEEFPHLPKVNMNVVELDQRVKVGNTYIKPFPVTHSIPRLNGYLGRDEAWKYCYFGRP